MSQSNRAQKSAISRTLTTINNGALTRLTTNIMYITTSYSCIVRGRLLVWYRPAPCPVSKSWNWRNSDCFCMSSRSTAMTVVLFLCFLFLSASVAPYTSRKCSRAGTYTYFPGTSNGELSDRNKFASRTFSRNICRNPNISRPVLFHNITRLNGGDSTFEADMLSFWHFGFRRRRYQHKTGPDFFLARERKESPVPVSNSALGLIKIDGMGSIAVDEFGSINCRRNCLGSRDTPQSTQGISCFVSTKAMHEASFSLRGALDLNAQWALNHHGSINGQVIAVDLENVNVVWLFSQKGCLDFGMERGFLAAPLFKDVTSGTENLGLFGDFNFLHGRENAFRDCVDNTTPWKKFVVFCHG